MDARFVLSTATKARVYVVFQSAVRRYVPPVLVFARRHYSANTCPLSCAFHCEVKSAPDTVSALISAQTRHHLCSLTSREQITLYEETVGNNGAASDIENGSQV